MARRGKQADTPSGDDRDWLLSELNRHGAETLRAKVSESGYRLSHGQNIGAALLLLNTYRHDWFGRGAGHGPDHHMMRLLIGAFAHDILGTNISKKEAWRIIGVADIKTARKYVQQAEADDLLRSIRSAQDKRLELLSPTPKLKKMLETEFIVLIDSWLHGIDGILKDPLPDTGAPILKSQPRPGDTKTAKKMLNAVRAYKKQRAAKKAAPEQ